MKTIEPQMTRVVMGDGSVAAELWTAAAEACPYCGRTKALWEATNTDYHVCIGCQRGWPGPLSKPHRAATNDAVAQIVKQLRSAPREGV